MEKEINIIELIKEVWSCRRKVGKWTIIGLVVGVIIAFSIPNKYSTFVKIAPEEKTESLSGTTGALASMIGFSGGTTSQGINKELYPEIIKSSPFIMEFAYIKIEQDNGDVIPLWEYLLKNQKKPWWSYVFGLPSKLIAWTGSLFSTSEDNNLAFENSPKELSDFIDAFSSNVSLDINKKSGIITLTSTFQSPKVAKEVADSMTAKLQVYMTSYRTQKTRLTLKSNTLMMNEAQDKYYKAEQNYANAVDKNQNLTSKVAQIKLERLQNERNLAFTIYQQLAGQVELDKIKLQENIPIATVIEPAKIAIRKSAPKRTMTIVAIMLLFAIGSGSIVVINKIKET